MDALRDHGCTNEAGGPVVAHQPAALTSIADRTTVAIPTRSGPATRRTSSVGRVSVREAHIRVTAATSDMVRPHAAASATRTPMWMGATPCAAPGPAKKPNRLCVTALPEPL